MTQASRGNKRTATAACLLLYCTAVSKRLTRSQESSWASWSAQKLIISFVMTDLNPIILQRVKSLKCACAPHSHYCPSAVKLHETPARVISVLHFCPENEALRVSICREAPFSSCGLQHNTLALRKYIARTAARCGATFDARRRSPSDPGLPFAQGVPVSSNLRSFGQYLHRP